MQILWEKAHLLTYVNITGFMNMQNDTIKIKICEIHIP